jgi:hypothetical protein
MTAFLYFVENLNKPVALDDVGGLGLPYAFEETPQSSPISGRTPTGAHGMLIWNQQRLGEFMPAFNPDQQTWRKVPGRDDLHIGIYTDAPPTPATLRKTGGMAGEVVTLGDGKEWIAPRLATCGGDNGFSPAYALVADLDEQGNWISGGASIEAHGLKGLFDRLYAVMPDPGGMSAGAALDFACELLAINYAVSKVELAMLKVLKTDDSLFRILTIALDWDTFIDWSKKKIQELSPADSAG